MTPFEIAGQLDTVLSRVISLDRGMPLMLRHRLQARTPRAHGQALRETRLAFSTATA